jgi:hypothetical protein
MAREECEGGAEPIEVTHAQLVNRRHLLAQPCMHQTAGPSTALQGQGRGRTTRR